MTMLHLEKKSQFYIKIEIKGGNRDYEKMYGISKGNTVLIAPYSDSIESLEKRIGNML